MGSLRIEAAIEPVPLSRTKVNRRNGGRYINERSRRFREQFSWAAKQAMIGREILTGELECRLFFYKPITPLDKRYGDLDNLTKAVFDACNGIVWADDSQVVKAELRKYQGAAKIILEVEAVAADYVRRVIEIFGADRQ